MKHEHGDLVQISVQGALKRAVFTEEGDHSFWEIEGGGSLLPAQAWAIRHLAKPSRLEHAALFFPELNLVVASSRFGSSWRWFNLPTEGEGVVDWVCPNEMHSGWDQAAFTAEEEARNWWRQALRQYWPN